MSISLVPTEAQQVAAPERLQVMQGVYEERSPFPGTRAFVVYDPDGRRLVNLVAASQAVDHEFLSQMRAFAERVAKSRIRLVE